MYHVVNNIYLNQSIAFTGLNASGKTQVLKMLSFVMNLMQARSVNSLIQWPNAENNMLNLGEKPAYFTIYFYDDKQSLDRYKLSATIGRTIDESDNQLRYTFVNEYLFKKKLPSKISKTNMFKFNDKDECIATRTNEAFLSLPDDVSLLTTYYKKQYFSKIFYRDLLRYTQFNFLSSINNMPQELFKFLDPSLELLEFKRNKSSSIYIKLKFKERDEIINLEVADLDGVLSSGTIKGLGIFSHALMF